MNLTNELFNLIHRREGYRHIGRQLSYKDHIDHENHRILICFQGSNGLSDWIHNFLAIPDRAQPYRGCDWWVHKGFARVWRSGNDVVTQDARELWEKFGNSGPDSTPYELIFCGFSHGAALAQLVAEDYGFRFGGRPRCVCFGSPKLAWGDGTVAHLQGSIDLANWINRADVITMVPLRRWGYRHIREDFVSVRRIPLLSKLRVHKHHQIYGDWRIYP